MTLPPAREEEEGARRALVQYSLRAVGVGASGQDRHEGGHTGAVSTVALGTEGGEPI